MHLVCSHDMEMGASKSVLILTPEYDLAIFLKKAMWMELILGSLRLAL